jgi:hypothetical protein
VTPKPDEPLRRGPGAGPAEEDFERLLEEMIDAQRRRLFALARRIEPGIAPEDLLQPHDVPRIAGSADFQFEDGILAGYLAIRAALRARR